ncbi:hypothetical protein DU500_05965 [Haloplanus rubicundus]|uniref:DUF7995 domain-containing protein n=1 Tax=Haloplanus rubicundus TaxID=1547898 RepID=A0A345E1F4_9EURY|nr:hypothetical protein [Haloplanus rubicundus]AXG06026.1 hypothetical protein DU500_05965 [Haloplanus rubicundus]
MVQRMLVTALVPAAETDEAVSAARCTFDRLVGFGTREPVFESYAMFDHETVSRDRWGDWPPATRVRTEPGASLLERQWAETLTAFLDRLEQLCDALRAHSSLDLMGDAGDVRRVCAELGATEGPTIYVYDQYGLGIRHRNRLDAVLGQDEQVWIVPAEVRY